MKPEFNIEPEIIIKRVKGKHGAGHHGGAWKIAYADFVTAMMAFFLLMWIIGATNEKQRKGIADYFTPTVIQMKNSGGSNGVMGGQSLQESEGTAPHTAAGPGLHAVPMVQPGQVPAIKSTGSENGPAPGARRAADEEKFKKVERIVAARLAGDPTMKGLKSQIHFVRTRDGLRIDIVERADFSMFGSGNSVFSPEALKLVRTVAGAIQGVPNKLTVRGHTDSSAYNAGAANNWTLSTLRADATRRALADAGIDDKRFRRIEGVADTDPYTPTDPADPRNRRISVTLMYRD